MIKSYLDTVVAEKEFALMNDQNHFEKVWSRVEKKLNSYIEGYFEDAQNFKPAVSPRDSMLAYLANVVIENDRLNFKYHTIFSKTQIASYKSNPKAFKDICLKKDCDLIRTTLKAKTAALNEWKMKFHASKPEVMFDTFANFLEYADKYNLEITEDKMAAISEIYDITFDKMDQKGCYKSGVVGYGVVSNILGHMYPRVFPGEYRSGIFALHFLSDGNRMVEEIAMPSETSEFVMVKDNVRTKTGIIETEHNFFFPYFVYTMYALNIFRKIEIALKEKYDIEFDCNYRYLLTNDFFSYVVGRHREEIKTLTGNDDIYKYKIAC